MHPTLNIAISAARKAGNLLLRSMDRLDTINTREKGSHDYVTDLDKRAEEEIIGIIRKAYPDHQIIAEESGLHAGGSEFLWLIDPIDGTHNFSRGVPHFAISIAFVMRGVIEHGVIYDPVRQEMFAASRGQGARLNDRQRLRVSKTTKLDKALIGTGFPVRSPEKLAQFLPTFQSLMPNISNIRCSGSAALDLAYVAAGRIDGFLETGLHAWDIGAGALMVKESGGHIGDWAGEENYLQQGSVVAGGFEVYQALLEELK